MGVKPGQVYKNKEQFIEENNVYIILEIKSAHLDTFKTVLFLTSNKTIDYWSLNVKTMNDINLFEQSMGWCHVL